MLRTLACGLALAATPLAALDLRAPDAERFQQFEAHFGVAIRQALAEGAPADIAVLTDVLSGGTDPGRGLSGDWRCRWIKMGGPVPLVVYRDFACRIEANETGWTLSKLTGSQRFTGRLEPTDMGDGLLYAGVAFVGDAPATDYAGLPPEDQTPVEPNQTVAQVGLFQQVSDDRARLLLPAPILESRFDVIALTR